MKKIGILFTLIIIVACGWLGFKITAAAYPALTGSPTTDLTASPSGTQQNLFLIHVNDLQDESPQLVSVWALFLLYSDTPSLVFRPIIQQDLSQPVSPTVQQFALCTDGTVAPDFIHALKTEHNLSVDGYVILDDEALRIFAQRFPGEQPTPRPFEVPRPDERSTIMNMCAYLQPAAARQGVELPWEQVLPRHFRTDLKFDPFMANWIRLTQAPGAPICEVID